MALYGMYTDWISKKRGQTNWREGGGVGKERQKEDKIMLDSSFQSLKSHFWLSWIFHEHCVRSHSQVASYTSSVFFIQWTSQRNSGRCSVNHFSSSTVMQERGQRPIPPENSFGDIIYSIRKLVLGLSQYSMKSTFNQSICSPQN